MKERFTRKEFLDALFGDYFRKRDGFLVVRSTKHLDRRVSTRFFPSIEVLGKEHYQSDQEVYLGICPRQSMKPESADIRYLTSLWAGVDLEPEGYSGKQAYFESSAMAAKAVRSFPLPPSIIVESGHGMHLYWLLRDVMAIEDVPWLEKQLQRINSYFLCKGEAKIDALLRLPGTYNIKVSMHPVLCEVKYLNTDFRYAPEDFESVKLATDADNTSAAVTGTPARTGATVLVKESFRGPSHESVEDRSEELRPFLEEDPGRGPQPFRVRTQASSKRAERPASQVPEPRRQRILEDFEPLPYEPEDETPSAPQEDLSSVSLDALADRVADRVVDKLAHQFSDILVERIVNELTKRLFPR